MIHFLKLIRIQNLIIIGFIQYALKYFIIEPMLAAFPIEVQNKVHFYELESQFSDFHFTLLVTATVLIAAAGYVINDYFDRKTDMLNRPESVVVGKYIKRRTAMTLHVIFNTIAIIIGAYISWVIHLWQLGFIFILTTGLLWYYSTIYKKQLVIGNLIVAVLAALVPLLVSLYEIPALNHTYRELVLKYKVSFLPIFHWCTGFALFAFVSTMIREIIKDTEDLEGDNAYGCNTIPIAWGINSAGVIVSLLSVFMIASLAHVYYHYHTNYYSLVYFSVISIFLLLSSILFFKANNKNAYKRISLLMKLTMIIGILYAPFIYFTQATSPALNG